MSTHLTSRPPEKGTVYLVGAGPGDPDLLTLRAAHLLANADIVFHDDLVPDAILDLCGPQILKNSVGKRCGQPRITQAGIHALLIDSARQNISVVRLKSGDPLVFGRAAEELTALREANIPVEIVPGISAVFAAGAALHLPLTDRLSASKLILIAGHHAAGKAPHVPIWTGPVPADATLAIYMPGRNLAPLMHDLLGAGLQPHTPCVAISRAATPRQQVTAGHLCDLSSLPLGPAPLLLLVGPAMQPILAAPNPLRQYAMLGLLAENGIALDDPTFTPGVRT